MDQTATVQDAEKPVHIAAGGERKKDSVTAAHTIIHTAMEAVVVRKEFRDA